MKKKSTALLILLFVAIFSVTAQSSGERAKKQRTAFIKAAKTYLGTPYVWGGTDRTGVDCSGFVYLSYRDAGFGTLPRTAALMYDFAEKIKGKDFQGGDLVFFKDGGSISHVGIYLGNNEFIHAASDGTKTGVIISKLSERYWSEHFYDIRRIFGASPTSVDDDEDYLSPDDDYEDDEDEPEIIEDDSDTKLKSKSKAKAKSKSKTKQKKTKAKTTKKKPSLDDDDILVKVTDIREKEEQDLIDAQFDNRPESAFAIDVGAYGDWNSFIASNNSLALSEPPVYFRGGQLEFGFRTTALEHNFGFFVKGKYDMFGTFTVPVGFEFDITSWFSVYAAGVWIPFSSGFNMNTIPGSTKYASTGFTENFTAMAGIRFKTPEITIGTLGLSFVQEFSYTYLTGSQPLTFAENLAAGLSFTTGLKIGIPI